MVTRPAKPRNISRVVSILVFHVGLAGVIWVDVWTGGTGGCRLGVEVKWYGRSVAAAVVVVLVEHTEEKVLYMCNLEVSTEKQWWGGS